MKVNRDFLSAAILDQISTSELRALRTFPVNASQFGEQLVAQRTPIIELNSSYGRTRWRDTVEVSGTGAVVSGTGTINMSSGTTTGSTALLKATETGRYLPGKGAEIGINVIPAAQPTGDGFIEWGGVTPDGQNRIAFGWDATGVYILVVRGGAQVTKVYQSAWNLDKADGAGTSGITLDMLKGNIFQIDFTWYGSGEIVFSIVSRFVNEFGDRAQTPIAVHSFGPENDVSIDSPNLTPFVEVDNGTGAQDISVRVGGRQYSIIGQYEPKTRLSSTARFANRATTTAIVPLISCRFKTGFKDRSVRLNKVQAFVSGQSHLLEVRFGGTLTGASFGAPLNHAADETALEYDTAASAITGGDVIFQTLAAAGSGNQVQLSDKEQLDFDLPTDTILTLCARAASGSGDVPTSLLQMQEEW